VGVERGDDVPAHQLIPLARIGFQELAGYIHGHPASTASSTTGSLAQSPAPLLAIQIDDRLAITGLTFALVGCLIGGQQFTVRRLERDDELIEIGDAATPQLSFDVKWYADGAAGADFLYFDAGSLSSSFPPIIPRFRSPSRLRVSICTCG